MSIQPVVPAYVPARLRARTLEAVGIDREPYLVTDEYGRIVHASGAARDLLAARTERLIGKLFIYRVGAESRAVVSRLLTALREGNHRARVPVVLRTFVGGAFRTELEGARAISDEGTFFVLRLQNTTLEV